MKQNLAIIFTNFGLGGVQRRMVDIANYISVSSEYKNTTTTFLVKQLGNFNFTSQLNKCPKINVYSSSHFFRLTKPKNLLFLVYTNFMLLFKIKPDTILVFFHYSVLSVLLYKLCNWQTRLVLSQDNIISLYNQKPHINRVYPKLLLKALYFVVDIIIVQTHTAKNDLIKYIGVKQNKIHVIPNWVPKTIPKKLAKHNERKYDLLYAGRFVPQKRLSLFIEFCRGMIDLLPNFRVVLIGEGPEEVSLRKLIHLYCLEKNVTILPPTNKQEQYLNQSKFLLLTSKFEGHPMILTEAMAVGVIPLVLEYLGCKEYIQDNWDGIIDRSVNSLINRVLLFYTDRKKAQQFSDQVAKSSQIRFNHTFLMEKTLNLLLQ